MCSNITESDSFIKKKYNHSQTDSDNSYFFIELNGNNEEFKEFLDYIIINIEKYENKIKVVYENIQNSFDNPENLGKYISKIF